MIDENLEESKNVKQLLKKAKMLRESEDYENAIKIYDGILKKEKDNAKALNAKGSVLYSQRKYMKALILFEKALKVDGNFHKALYNKGLVLYRFKRYEDALRFFNEAIQVKKNYTICYNAQGTSLFKLGRYKDAVDAFNKAKVGEKDALPYINAAEAYLLQENLVSARGELEKALEIGGRRTNRLIVDGRIKIEEKDYDGAIKSFGEAASSDMENPRPLLWDAYAKYLKAECSIDTEYKGKEEIFSIIREQKYKEGMFSIIRELENANELCKKKEKEKLRACILYFLGYFYYKSKDTFAAKERLEECINLKSKSQAKQRAHELLDSIWNYTIKPPWWRWWLWSPLHRWSRRMIFLILLIPLFSLLLNPVIPKWLPFFKVDLTVSLIVLLLSIFIILSPSISSIKAEKFEVELRSPPSLELFITPPKMKEGIEEQEDSEEHAAWVILIWKKLYTLFSPLLDI